MVRQALAAGRSENSIVAELMLAYGMTWGEAEEVLDIETGRHPEGDVHCPTDPGYAPEAMAAKKLRHADWDTNWAPIVNRVLAARASGSAPLNDEGAP